MANIVGTKPSDVGSIPTSPANQPQYGFTHVDSMAYEGSGVTHVWLDRRLAWQSPNVLPNPIYIDPESGKEVSEDWWPDVV